MQVDLSAVSRIAKRVDLRDIRLVELNASMKPGQIELLEPSVSVECRGDLPLPDRIVVLCEYRFGAKSGGVEIAKAQAKYILVYELLDSEPVAEADLKQFANANGTYHSWPFLRQLLFDLTSKMGLPPFTLPVFNILPQARPPRTEISQPALPAPKATKRRKGKVTTR